MHKFKCPSATMTHVRTSKNEIVLRLRCSVRFFERTVMTALELAAHLIERRAASVQLSAPVWRRQRTQAAQRAVSVWPSLACRALSRDRPELGRRLTLIHSRRKLHISSERVRMALTMLLVHKQQAIELHSAQRSVPAIFRRNNTSHLHNTCMGTTRQGQH
jgi:hypothetical protein